MKLPEVDFPQIDWGEKKKGVSLPSHSSHLPRGWNTPKHLTAALGSTEHKWQHPTAPDRGHSIPGESFPVLSVPSSSSCYTSVPRGGSGWEPRAKGVEQERQKGKDKNHARSLPCSCPRECSGYTHTPLLLQHQDLSVFSYRETLTPRGTQPSAFTEQLLIVNKLISHGSFWLKTFFSSGI